MRNFLDNVKIDSSKVYILYGNVDDIYCTKDFIVHNTEFYLLDLLKSYGYKHVVFYSSSDRRGEFCLDPESARAIFGGNNVSEVTRHDIAEGKVKVYEPKNKEAAAPAPAARPAMMKPGIMDLGAMGALGGNTAKKAEEKVEAKEEKKEEKKSVQYKNGAMEYNNFLTNEVFKISEGHDDYAVVLYNMHSDLTDPGNIFNIPQFNACVNSGQWDASDKHFLWLIINNTDNKKVLINDIMQAKLEGYFLTQGTDEQTYLKNNRCIRIGSPRQDEIASLLRYYYLKYRKDEKVKIDIADAEQIAKSIQVTIQDKIIRESKNNNERSTDFDLRRIKKMLDNYLEESEDGVLDESRITTIFGGENRTKEEELERLNKAGWEKAYETVKLALEMYQYKEQIGIRKYLENGGFAESEERLKENIYHVARLEERISALIQNHEDYDVKVPNFILLGNPGTGKTTIARIIGAVLRKYGILSSGHFIEATKQDFTSEYVSGSLKNTQRKIDEAEGGVLFIDEMQNLAVGKGAGEHSSSSNEGKDIISTLNAAMTNPARHFCLILAGYEFGLEGVMGVDPGFESRFHGNIIRIDDYKPELLEKIFKNKVAQDNAVFDEALTEETENDKGVRYVPLTTMIERVYESRDRAKFGNARDMNTLAEDVLQQARKANRETIIKEDFVGRRIGDKMVIDETFFEPTDLARSKNGIIQEIEEEFIGLENIKEWLRRLGTKIARNKAKGLDTKVSNGLIFRGNPGTGKSTLARKLAKFYYQYELTGSPKTIIVAPRDLATTAVGGAVEKMNEYIKKAQNEKALLFIDEAHQVLDPGLHCNGVIKALMDPMQDKEKPFYVICAVYPQYYDDFMRIDPGNSRRFQTVDMPDYNAKEMFEIMKLKMGAARLAFADEAAENAAERLFENIEKARQSIGKVHEKFGNAGDAERVLDKLSDIVAQRYEEEGIEYAKDECDQIIETDITECDWLKYLYDFGG